jgi:hypothetical protein
LLVDWATGKLPIICAAASLARRKPYEPVSTWMLLMVWQLLVPGAHTVTDTFGILTKFCAPGPTVIGTVFDAVDAIGCALGVLLEPPPLLPLLPLLLLLLLPLLTELLPESPPPPPQAASNIDTLSTASQRNRPERRGTLDEKIVGRIVEVSVRYWMSLGLTPAGKDCGR